MSGVLRSWLGFLALAAGLVHVALVIGSPPAVAVVLLVVGAAEFTWGAITIARPTPPVPRLALAVAFAPVIGWALLLVIAGADSLGPLTSGRQLFPMLIASLFDLLVAGGLTALLRRSASHSNQDAAAPAARESAPAHPIRRLVAVIVGALLIGAITAPALAATEAGSYLGPGTSVFDTGGHDH